MIDSTKLPGRGFEKKIQEWRKMRDAMRAERAALAQKPIKNPQ